MRKNSRWASSAQSYTAHDTALAASLGLRRTGNLIDSSGGSERREVELMSAFMDLKREVRDMDSASRLVSFDGVICR